MEEKIITGHKNGMLVLLLELVLYIAAVVFLIVGINAGFLPLVVLCVILLLLGWIPLCGLRVLKPHGAYSSQARLSPLPPASSPNARRSLLPVNPRRQNCPRKKPFPPLSRETAFSYLNE